MRCDGVDVQVHLPQVGEARNSRALHALLLLRRAGLLASVRLRGQYGRASYGRGDRHGAGQRQVKPRTPQKRPQTSQKDLYTVHGARSMPWCRRSPAAGVGLAD